MTTNIFFKNFISARKIRVELFGRETRRIRVEAGWAYILCYHPNFSALKIFFYKLKPEKRYARKILAVASD